MPKAKVLTTPTGAKIVRELPRTEDGVGCLCRVKEVENTVEYVISQNTSKEKNSFTLWKVVRGGYEKISSADTPQELAQQIGLGVFPGEEQSSKPEKLRKIRTAKK